MEETSLLYLPEGMLIEQIQISSSRALPPLPHHVVRSVPNRHRRSIVTIVGSCVMSRAQAGVSGL